MSQQYPQQPNWGQPPQQHQQPAQWGTPHQQPQPGWGAPPPQPPKKTSAGKIIGLGCAGVLALLVITGIFGAAVGGDSDDDSSKGSAASSEANVEDTAADAEAEKEEPAEEAAPESPVKITAKKTAFAKSILADGSNYTSVLVTVTNKGDEPIDVNPLYFAITDSTGTKHAAELAVDENQIDTVDLAPGENISGTITGKGTFTAKYVTYTDGFLGESLRADVS